MHAAIWDQDGEVDYGGEDSQGFRVVLPQMQPPKQGIRHVTARSLNSLFDEFELDEVDYVKMDIEGAEAVVFRGDLQWLNRVRTLKVELHSPMTYEECATVLVKAGLVCRRDDKHDQCLVATRPNVSLPLDSAVCAERHVVAVEYADEK